SKFPLSSLVSFALDGILAHSVLPLRFATLVGFAVGAGTIVATLAFLVAKLVFGFAGSTAAATVALLVAYSLSLTALLLGVIGQYLRRLYEQSRGRPLVIIESSINLPNAPSSIRVDSLR